MYVPFTTKKSNKKAHQNKIIQKQNETKQK